MTGIMVPRRMRFNIYGGAAAVDRSAHVIYGVSALQAVEALGHRMLIDRTTLEQFVDISNGKPKGLKSRFTHPGLSADGMGKFLGRMRDFRIDGDKAIGDLHLSDTAARSPHGDLRDYVESLAESDPEAFGMSIVFEGYGSWVLSDGSEVDDAGHRPDGARDKMPTARIVDTYAVDAVDEPAANRDGLFGAFSKTTNLLAADVYKLLDGREGIEREIGRFLETGEIGADFAPLLDEYDIDEEKARVFAAHYLEHRRRHPARAMTITLAAKAADRSIPMEKETTPDAAVEQPAVIPQTNEWLAALQATAAQAMIQASGLHPATQARLARGRYSTPQDVSDAIDAARIEQAALQEAQVVTLGGRPPRATGMTDATDEARGIVDWMFGVGGSKTPPANMRRFSELYVAMTGDSEFRGLFDPTRTMFAAATTATLPNMAVDAMNKVIVEQIALLSNYRWFEQLVKVEPNNGTLHDMKWITVGGLSNLPTVGEGASYTELNVDDAKETASFIKRGGYVGITREVIKNSDIQKIQAIPRALANAAIRTRSAAVSALFTANSGVGPTLAQDSTALFDTNGHVNLLTSAFDVTAWRKARAECFQHTELGSGAVLGVFPRFALIPAELWDAALVAFGYGDGTPVTYTPEAMGRSAADPRPVPVVVPDWTDPTDWAYLVDPAVFPVIQMSYSQNIGGGSHPAPELFSVVSETSGLLFTNDTLPIKVRDEFAVGVNGPRGIGKRNVTD